MKKASSELKNLLFKIAGIQYSDFVTIFLHWDDVVGTLLSERSQVARFEDKTLYVQVPSHVWKQEFELLKPKFIKKLVKSTNIKIENIRFFE